jgi:hypothetical protein
LMRTLYCFIRLLPGFQLLQLSFSTPILNFRIYNPDEPQPVAVKSFHFDTATYEFPRIQTFRGTLCLGVRHVGPAIIQVHTIYQYYVLHNCYFVALCVSTNFRRKV